LEGKFRWVKLTAKGIFKNRFSNVAIFEFISYYFFIWRIIVAIFKLQWILTNWIYWVYPIVIIIVIFLNYSFADILDNWLVLLSRLRLGGYCWLWFITTFLFITLRED